MKWLFAFLLTVPTVALAQHVVNQGQGQTSNGKPWTVQGATAGTSGTSLNTGPGVITSGAPDATVSISGTSAAATGLAASGCYRVACNAACFFRTGTGTPTALTSDNAFYGPAVEKICLPSTDTAIAFIMSSGTGSCTLARLK